jgi:multidrug resistance efflux pump
MFTRYLLPTIAIVLLLFAVRYVSNAQKPEAPLKPPAEPPRSPYGESVAGTGVVEPRSENISVGTQLPGIVVEVFVVVNEKVKAGAPLFRLDDRELKARLALMQAQAEQARANLTRLKNLPREEDKPVARAKVAQAEAALADKASLYKRAQELVVNRAMSEEERSVREQAYLMAKAQLAQSNAELELLEAGSWKYDIDVAEKQGEQAQAQVDQVKTDLERLTVRALVDGEVLQVNVRPGEYVGVIPGQIGQAFIVLGTVDKLHVRVSIDEHDIPRYRLGANGTAYLKGASTSGPGYPLSFVRVEPFVVPKKSLTGDNTERVDTRVLQLIYSVDAQPKPLYVGQQVDVFLNGRDDLMPTPSSSSSTALSPRR